MVMGILSIRRLEALLGRRRDDLRRLADHAGRYYRSFEERPVGGNGRWRRIDAPMGELKSLQERLQRGYLAHIGLPPTMVGGVRGGSLDKNTWPHAGKPLVITMDLKDCFGRTTHTRVFEVFRNTLGCSTEVALLLTKLTTFRGRVPQGAPTSNAIVNLVMLPMHRAITDLAARVSVDVTQWVDDITLSGAEARRVLDPIIRRIHQAGYAIRRSKMEIATQAHRQTVTGVTVNVRPSAGRPFVQDVIVPTLRLLGEGSVPAHVVESLRGKVAHIASLSPRQARRAQRLVNALPPEIYSTERTAKIVDRRQCSRRRRRRGGPSLPPHSLA